jgi:hypothetical protein
MAGTRIRSRGSRARKLQLGLCLVARLIVIVVAHAIIGQSQLANSPWRTFHDPLLLPERRALWLFDELSGKRAVPRVTERIHDESTHFSGTRHHTA